MTNPRLRIAQLGTDASNLISVPATGITCIVGANNAGKSRMLRDLVNWTTADELYVTCLSEVRFEKPQLDLAAAESWLNETASRRPQPNPPTTTMYVPPQGGQDMTVVRFLDAYDHHPERPGTAGGFWAWYAPAGSLLSYAVSGGGMPGMLQLANDPISRMYRDWKYEAAISQISHEVFGVHLTLDRATGDTRLRAGTTDVPVPPLNRPTVEYAQAMRALRTLEDQGDGMKSFLGLALNIVAGNTSLIFLDEPEAFLHPGQARALGRWLAAQAAERDLQVFLATHDRDLLIGMLSAKDCPVNVLRIDRDSSQVTHIRQLKADEVSKLWDIPVLRYSNILQGLFHRQVVICEGDSDCRFFGAVLDVLAVENGQRSLADDTLFVPSGGKGQAKVLAAALSNLGVVGRVIVDFDVLEQKSEVQALVAALGFEWTPEMQADYLEFATAANKFNSDHAALWKILKNSGLHVLPAGQGYAACERLLRSLADLGVLVVRQGEMEDLDKEIPERKAQWVTRMLGERRHESCREARELIAPLLSPAPPRSRS